MGNPIAIDLGQVRIDLSSGSRRYRHYDYRANFKLVTDSAGNVVTHYEYGAFGSTTVYGDSNDPYRFVKGRAIGDLYLVGARLYDPSVARFLAPDPIFQLINQYAYASGNPAFLADPSGQAGVDLAVAMKAGQIGGAIFLGAIGFSTGSAIAGPIGAGVGLGIYGELGAVIGQAAVLMVYQAIYQERGAEFPGLLPPVIGGPAASLSNLGSLPAITAPSGFEARIDSWNERNGEGPNHIPGVYPPAPGRTPLFSGRLPARRRLHRSSAHRWR